MKKKPKTYTGSCYIGVCGPDAEIGECRDSIESIARRPGDMRPRYVRATKGYEARQTHLNKWINETQHPFALFLDHDMIYPEDTLERLRSHGLPYVSGYYLRRTFSPIYPVWFHLKPGAWPMRPYTTIPERGKLHPLGASGWGCILIHRDVIEATRAVLKGEGEILEDDMDIWPYNLHRVMASLNGLQEIVDNKLPPAAHRAALEKHVRALREEIRVLRGDKNIVGSDIRFPFFAHAAGFTLYGDPDVRCGHMLNYPLHPDDYEQQKPEDAAALDQEVSRQLVRTQREMRGIARRAAEATA